MHLAARLAAMTAVLLDFVRRLMIMATLCVDRLIDLCGLLGLELW